MGEYENGNYIPDALELSDLRAAGRVPARPTRAEPENWEEYTEAVREDDRNLLKRFDQEREKENNPWKEDYDEHEERQEYARDDQ